MRESTKYEHIVAFANALPAIRAKVREHIARRGLPREKVLATVVHLLNILGHKGDGRSDLARTKVRQFKADPKGKPSPIPLENCPWCETRFEPASFTLLPDDDKPRELRIFCANFECEVARRPLPIVAVDEPIYRRLPAFLIAIVDKFASLPWVNALNTVWKVEARKKVGIWQFVRTYLVSLAGVLALGFLLLVSLLLSTALSASGKYLFPASAGRDVTHCRIDHLLRSDHAVICHDVQVAARHVSKMARCLAWRRDHGSALRNRKTVD